MMKNHCSDLTEVDPEVLRKLPVNNLICERELSHMDRVVVCAASCSNHSFTAKSIRDNITLDQIKVFSIDNETKAIAKLLDEEESKYFMSQRDVAKGKFAEKRAKAMRKNNCINMLLKIYTTVAPSHLYENYKSTPKMLVTKQI